MIGRLEASFRRLRRALSRGEWGARLLGLASTGGSPARPGLVLVQIDGLSYNEFHRALRRGRMPFLSRLLGREGYAAHRLCSGVPSSTPAVQAELFYGVKGAVPAFEYYDRKKERMARMYDPAVVAEVERRLESKGAALLEGGSVHADIFTGGAVEGRFCVSSWGWKGWTARARLTPVLLILTHLFLPLRLAALAALEFCLAVADFARGVTGGQDFRAELKFIAARVGVSVLLREFAVMGAKVDVARGLPTVHLNFFGYDEQAHRRGPGSPFALWTLKGIDEAVRKVWGAAHRSARRSYDVWIYSDHGQEACVPFSVEKGRPLADAVAEAVHPGVLRPPMPVIHGAGATGRAAAHGYRGRLFSAPPRETDSGGDSGGGRPLIAAMGPLGHVYLASPAAGDGKAALARRLVDVAGIPLVMAETDRVRAWTPEGEFVFPEEAGRVLGEDHPFLKEASHDLAALCRHPDAGDFVISGWRRGRPLTLALENGSHGGPGPEEMGAFALLPPDAPLAREAAYLRPGDIRSAALRFLGRLPGAEPRGPSAAPRTFRVMTYNVHSCVGMDGKLSPERIARVIARHDPDVVALQELDVRRRRTGDMDQARFIAERLRMLFHFHPAVAVAQEKYGDAILSRWPLKLVRAANLPGVRGGEPRGAVWATASLDGRDVQVVNTHLGLVPLERRRQAEELMGPYWLGSTAEERVILCGDFNAGPGSAPCRRIARRFRDAQLEMAGRRPLATWFGRWPVGRIDHVFVGPGLEVLDVIVPATELDKTASDHLPLVVELRVK